MKLHGTIVAALASTVLMAGSAGASAQQAAPAANNDAQQKPAPLWSIQCVSTSRQRRPTCSMSQRIVVAETGRQLARLTLATDAKNPSTATFALQLPLGISVEEGVEIAVDDNPAKALRIQACEATGCFVSMELTAQFADELRKGTRLVARVKNLQNNEITIPFSLIGFTLAYRDIE